MGPYICSETPRKATGHGRGRGGGPNPFPLLRVFLNPSVTMCPLSLYFVWRHILHRVARNGKGRVSPLPHYFGELYLSFSPVWR